MLDHIKTAIHKANLDYTPLFPDLYYYFDMKFIKFGCGKDFNLLLQFLHLVLYQLEIISVSLTITQKHILTLDHSLVKYIWL